MANHHRDTFKVVRRFFVNVMQGVGLKMQEESIRSAKTFGSRYTACRKELKEYTEAALTLQALSVPTSLQRFEGLLRQENSIAMITLRKLGLERHRRSWSKGMKAKLLKWYSVS